MIASTTNPELT